MLDFRILTCYNLTETKKGGRKDEPHTTIFATLLHLATKNQNAWRLGKVESTTQRTHQRRIAGSTGESIQRRRVGNASRD